MPIMNCINIEERPIFNTFKVFKVTCISQKRESKMTMYKIGNCFFKIIEQNFNFVINNFGALHFSLGIFLYLEKNESFKRSRKYVFKKMHFSLGREK